ncbi:hypothetical protein [Paludibacterium denitrificans]|uniref:Uncharacterized protein n=1 Tax=Paludibacterium denitrificans TaxID=2675226 RepID=A0A844GCQ5_9NEIS|nr:hypothetical protein [Paludibacterium denitrificans]MTD33130.1 hypothetical protein [Paludibacterium denitrificans]
MRWRSTYGFRLLDFFLLLGRQGNLVLHKIFLQQRHGRTGGLLHQRRQQAVQMGDFYQFLDDGILRGIGVGQHRQGQGGGTEGQFEGASAKHGESFCHGFSHGQGV